MGVTADDEPAILIEVERPVDELVQGMECIFDANSIGNNDKTYRLGVWFPVMLVVEIIPVDKNSDKLLR